MAKTTLKILLTIAFSTVVLLFYLGLSFIFGGHELIKGVMGNDAWSYITRLKMLSDTFPNYPFWNYREAAGASLTYTYPILTHTLLIVTSKVFHINLFESFKLWGYLSVPLFAWGIYLYSTLRLKNVIIGLIAGVFYILSPISSIWIFEWGFYAESVASILFPFTFLAFDIFLNKFVDLGWKDKKTRILFLITALMMGITFLAHPTVFFGVLTFMIIYAFGLGLTSKEAKVKKVLSNLGITAFTTFMGVVTVAFWAFPFYHYTRTVASGDTSGKLTKQNYGIDLELLKVLSFEPFYIMNESEYFKSHSELAPGDSIVNGKVWEKGYIFRSFSFPKGISTLYLIGVVLSFVLFERKRAILFGLSALTLFAAVSDDLIIFLANTPLLSYFASWRSLIYADRILIPVVAAFACWSIFDLLLTLIKSKNTFVILFKNIFLSLTALTIAAIFLYNFRMGAGLNNPNYLSAYARNLALRDIWKLGNIPDDVCLLEANLNNSECQKLYPESLAAFKRDLNLDKAKSELSKLYGGDFEVNSGMHDLYSLIPKNDFIRYDFSPLQTSTSMRAAYFSETPMFNSYVHTAYLNRRLVGFEISNFYADDPVYPDPLALPEIAKWYGNSYFVVNPAEDADKFMAAGFEEIRDYLFKQNEENNIVEITQKPKILVISDMSKVAYDTIFKFSPFGFIDYNEATLIRGNEKVDSYSSEDLSKYDGIILYGYKYGSKNKGWKLLDDYVKKGGRLFIETGWQYVSADFETAGGAPAFLPVTSLKWGDVGMALSYEVSGLAEGIDTSNFPPLIWNNLPWGISKPTDLRDWATPSLSANGTPIMAYGSYGNGKVVWSGMNVFGHVKNFDRNNQELVLMGKMMDFLLEGKAQENISLNSGFSAARQGNDSIIVTINQNLDGHGIYLKEAFHPWWRANLVSGGKSQKLDIGYAGPGYKFINLPKASAGDKVEIYVDKTFINISKIISVFGLVATFILMSKPLLIKLPKIPTLPKATKPVNEDEDY